VTRTQRQIEVFRKGDACFPVCDALGRPCPGVPVSVEQESHEFPFGCVAPDLNTLAQPQRTRYQIRLDEVFNCVIPAESPPSSEPNVMRVEVAPRVHLGLLRLHLDELAASGHLLQLHIWGESVGISETAVSAGDSERVVGRRVAELYSLCFAHPSVVGVWWNGFADGEQGVRGGGLLRRDLAPKYAHKVLQKLVHFEWHTRATGMTDAEGCFRFRGFFGTYRVVADVGEPSARVETFHLSSSLAHLLNRPLR
jgi:hypothetical protein